MNCSHVGNVLFPRWESLLSLTQPIYKVSSPDIEAYIKSLLTQNPNL